MPASPPRRPFLRAAKFALRNTTAAYKDGGFYSLIKDLSNPKTAWLLVCGPTNAPVINNIA
jgi:hypothetical protein